MMLTQKILFSTLLTINLLFSSAIIHASSDVIKDLLKEKFDAVVLLQKQINEELNAVSDKIRFTLLEWIRFTVDKEKEAVRNDASTKKLFADFTFLNTQYEGLGGILNCLDLEDGPAITTQNLQKCYERTTEGPLWQRRLEDALLIDEALQYDRVCEGAYFRGKESIRKTVKYVKKAAENS